MQHASALPSATSQFPQQRAGASANAVMALALTLLTGLVLGQLLLPWSKAIEHQPRRTTVATRTGLEFYDAIDTYLATGETRALQGLVHPDFVDHVDGQRETHGYQALLEQLQTLRAFAAEAQLTATLHSSSGDLVQFALSISPISNAVVLGLEAAHTQDSTFIDTVRIAEGRIAERWSNFRSPIDVTSLASMTWDPPPAAQMLPAIKRVTVLSGGTLTLNVGTAHIILVESGSLTVSGTPRDTARSLPEFPSDTTDLADATPVVALPGSAIVAVGIPPYHIVNESDSVASALLIRIAAFSSPSGVSAGGTSQNDPGVQLETLSWAQMLPNHVGAWTVELGRATVLPGMTIPAHEVPGSELIVVESGVLDADLSSCEQHCVRTSAGAGAVTSEHVQVRSGEAISAIDGATTAFQVAGDTPATLLILTIVPVRA